jgi:hypothetical protein
MELQVSVDWASREIDLMSQRLPSFDPLTSVREFVVSMTDIAELLGLSRAIGALTASTPHCLLRSVRAPAQDVHRLDSSTWPSAATPASTTPCAQ